MISYIYFDLVITVTNMFSIKTTRNNQCSKLVVILKEKCNSTAFTITLFIRPIVKCIKSEMLSKLHYSLNSEFYRSYYSKQFRMKNGPYMSHQIRREEFQRLVGMALCFNDLLPLLWLDEMRVKNFPNNILVK